MHAKHSPRSGDLVPAIAAGCVAAYVACFAMAFAAHGWILDSGGHPLVTDFVSFWTAGHLAWHGAAATAYDPHIRHVAEISVVGHEFRGYLDWAYPPIFFFVAAALADLPYLTAFIVWIGLTLAMYGAVAGAVANSRIAMLIALAAPWVVADVEAGQNGFLTAALIGTVLLNLESRPVLSGIALGLLTYKPQFGLLFPLALAGGGHWRAIVWASVSACVALGLSCASFGIGTLGAFLHNLPETANAVLGQGGVSANKLQSVYGIVRWLGGEDRAGWLVQSIATLSLAAGIIWLWGSGTPYPLKAASLCAAALLATPYAFAYDLPILSIAFAFIYRACPFDKFEHRAVAFSVFCFLAIVFFVVPAAPLATGSAAAIVAKRMRKLNAGRLVSQPT